ncbi:MAG: hypothetical protein QXG65_05360 [Thermoplasmata archaeon]
MTPIPARRNVGWAVGLLSGILAVAAVTSLVPWAPAGAMSVADRLAAPAQGGGATAMLQDGNITTVHFSGSFAGGVYFGNLTEGFVVNESAQATGPNGTAYAVTGTYGIAYHLVFCRPNCTAPTGELRLSYEASAALAGYANLTNASHVALQSNGTTATVPAVGIVNASDSVRTQAMESVAVTGRPGFGWGDLFGTRGDRAGMRNGSLTARSEYVEQGSVAFFPSLGLYPASAPPAGSEWTSTANFTASAQAEANATAVITAGNTTFTLPTSWNRTIGPVTGEATLFGAIRGGDDGNGSWPPGVPRVVLRLDAPFLSLRAPFVVGVEVSPSAFERFGGDVAALPFGQGSFRFAGAILSHAGSHVGPLAGWGTRPVYQFGAGLDLALLGGTGGNASLSQTTLAAQPMTASQAGSAAACLEAGDCAAGSSPSPPASSLPIAGVGISGPLAVGLAAVGAVAAGTALVLVRSHRARRPRGPTPPAPPQP